MSQIRIQKFLSLSGFCSRRKGEEYILQGRVTVNGERVSHLGLKVDPETDRVMVDGKAVGVIEEPRVYIALNKPPGYVTSCWHRGEKIVLDLVDHPYRLYPVGRLDKESDGLLLLTNDGRLHHKLSHPSFDHEKEYEVTTAKPIPDSDLGKMARGIQVMGSKTRPADVTRLSEHKFRIVLKEGRNRQIRRMVSKLGNRVIRLTRRRVASIRLGSLPKGKWRYLTETEKTELLKML
jgi:23S rRNA pseudouridine2605 synthase/23S rRNA pseudouridine2604 synthase